jgi:FtsP/CotA-like multicopper oxidase with cupredoxin domain
VLFFITETSKNGFFEHPFHPSFTGDEREPNNPDIVAHAGTVEEWTLFNATAETHAFHIHQMVFTVLDPSDPTSRLELDTVPIHPGTFSPDPKASDPWTYPYEKPERVTIVMDLRHMHPGTFVFHCHMLAHEDRGMMGIIRVVP